MSERIRLVTAESDLEPAVADELVPRPEVLRGEALEARVAQAVEAVEFQPTPEVYEAIHGFYADHYQLAGFLSDSLLGQNPAVPAEFDPNTPHVIQQTILKLAETKQAFDQQPGDQEQQRQFLNEAIKAAQQLFAESSLGVTTIGEAELAVRRQLGDQILDFSRRQQLLHLLDSPEMTSYGQAHASGFVETHYRFTGFGPHDLSKDEINRRISEEPAVADRDGSNVFQAGVEGHAWGQFQLDPAFERGVEKATDSFWGDVRHASRLEFHGSNQMEEIIASGGLRSRLEQIRQTGDYNTQNVSDGWGGSHHTNTVKFSEYAPSGEYTRPTSEAQSPATIGIPIADIVAIAPFARNAEFASLTAKPESSDRLATSTEVGQITESIGTGGTEDVGATPAGSIQRAFFASPELDGQWAPDQYQIPVGGQAEANQILFTYHKPKPPQMNEKEYQRAYGDWGWTPPAEAHFNQHHILEPNPDIAANPDDAVDSNQRIVQAAQDAVSQDPKYRDSYVVPLRRGVFSFRPEESSSRDYSFIGENTPENYLRQAA